MRRAPGQRRCGGAWEAPAAAGGKGAPSQAAAPGRAGLPLAPPGFGPACALLCVSANGRRRWRLSAALRPRIGRRVRLWAERHPVRRRSGGRSARSGHDGAQLCAAACSLLRLLGPRGHRRPLVRAQGAEPRGDHHDAGHHRRVLLPFLAHRDPGPGQPPVRAAAEERDHLVRALPLGVSSPQEPVPEQRPPYPNHHPLAAVSASCTRHPPRGPGTEAGPSAPAHPEHCNLDQSLSTGGSTRG